LLLVPACIIIYNILFENLLAFYDFALFLLHFPRKLSLADFNTGDVYIYVKSTSYLNNTSNWFNCVAIVAGTNYIWMQMCKFELSRKEEITSLSDDSSEAYSKRGAFSCRLSCSLFSKVL